MHLMAYTFPVRFFGLHEASSSDRYASWAWDLYNEMPASNELHS